jgi:4-diphosphocytidyl-2-C-methyl-D-erythritol kinase
LPSFAIGSVCRESDNPRSPATTELDLVFLGPIELGTLGPVITYVKVATIQSGDPTWEVWTPAKINLFLEVLGRRSDGYHELETVMMAVSLYDTISFRVTSQPRIAVATKWTSGIAAQYCLSPQAVGDVPSPTKNIVTRALTLLQQQAEVGYGADVQLRKRIPSAAGLGGASSDGAAALAVANLAWGLHWPEDRLRILAGELGSDVPFFLTRHSAAICRGRGELIEPWRAGWRPHVVLVRPPDGLLTATVFRSVKSPGQPRHCHPLLDRARRNDYRQFDQHMTNRLQEPASQLCPWIDRLSRLFDHLPVVAHQMSGSGSTYFAVCRHAQHARQIAAQLRSQRVGYVAKLTATQAYPIIRRPQSV